VVVFEELPGELVDTTKPPEFKYAFCGAPMYGMVRADWVLQWMTYHHFLADGKAHFLFYNLGGLAKGDRAMFQRFLDAGKLSITDVLDPNLVADYPTWYHHQVLFINDCLHRSRFMAERVFFIDYDEFVQGFWDGVQVPAPDTLSEFMARHEKEPWISFGSVYANTQDCRRGVSHEAVVERMVWRRPAPACRQKAKTLIDPWLCIGPLGRRKFVVNPVKTFAAGVHGVTIPAEGLNLKGDEARILHYRSAPTFKTRLCGNNVKDEKAVLDAGWIRDESTSKIYAHAKLFPI
jgi:hypothetical protein